MPSTSFSCVLAAAEAAQNPFFSLIPIILIFGIFYLLLIAPMRRRQKALQRLVENLKKGDRVVTNGGLFGEVVGIEGNVVFLKVADHVKIRVAKSAIAGLEDGGKQGGGQ